MTETPDSPLRPRLLLVDDEESVRVTFPLVLASLGLEVETASSTSEAERLVDEGRFAVVVTDLHFDGEPHPWGGFDLLRALRLRYPELPVVVMTAFPSAEIRTEAIALGARELLPKSLPIPVLLALLRGLELVDASATRSS